MMNRVVWFPLIAAAMLWFALAVPASAAERSVTLGVRMYCPSCAYVVRRALKSVLGVNEVRASLETQTAVVIYEDLLVQVSDLVAATEGVGYETKVLSAGAVSPRGLAMSRARAVQDGDDEDGMLGHFAPLRRGLTGPTESAESME